MKTIELPSGAKLDITPSDFDVSKKLYMVISSEARNLKIDPNDEMDANLYKDLILSAMSSDKIDAAIWDCFGRCTYNGLKVTKDTFEPVEARGDYLIACFEVAVENVSPFMKPLFARFAGMFKGFSESLQSMQKKTI